jgi:hypothetical protein
MAPRTHHLLPFGSLGMCDTKGNHRGRNKTETRTSHGFPLGRPVSPRAPHQRADSRALWTQAWKPHSFGNSLVPCFLNRYSLSQALTILRPADGKEFRRRLASWPHMLKTLVFEPQSTR